MNITAIAALNALPQNRKNVLPSHSRSGSPKQGRENVERYNVIYFISNQSQSVMEIPMIDE